MVSYYFESYALQSQIGGGSRASQRSRGGVSKASHVDETLFGNSKSKAGAANGVAVVSLEELRDIRRKTEKNNQNDAVIISKGDLERIKAATTVKTKE